MREEIKCNKHFPFILRYKGARENSIAKVLGLTETNFTQEIRH